MKNIEEYHLTGTINNEEINGKVILYTKNMKKAKKRRLKTSVIRGAVGVMVLGLTIGVASNLIKPDPKIELKPAIEMAYEEPTGEIKYVIKAGDTLESIVRRYKDTDILKEIDKIAKTNNLESPDKIYSGQELIINVPISKLDVFGFGYDLGEVNEWDAMDYFVSSAFEATRDSVHPENVLYWREKVYIIGGDSPHDIETYGQAPLLMKAASAIYDYELMNDSQAGFYTTDDIKAQENKILSIYLEAIEITERLTGKTYGVDYILDAPIITNEKGLGR